MITLTKVKQATSTFIKVLRFGLNDVQTSLPILPHGIDSKPVSGQTGIHAKTTNRSDSIFLGVVYKSSVTSEGETRIFATDSDGTEVFDILLKNDGTCEFGGNSDYMVRFNELKTGFDQLRSDFNSFLIHVHGVAGTPPVPPATPSIASIDGAKIDSIKTL